MEVAVVLFLCSASGFSWVFVSVCPVFVSLQGAAKRFTKLKGKVGLFHVVGPLADCRSNVEFARCVLAVIVLDLH